MKVTQKIIIIALLLSLIFSLTAVSASENTTFEQSNQEVSIEIQNTIHLNQEIQPKNNEQPILNEKTNEILSKSNDNDEYIKNQVNRTATNIKNYLSKSKGYIIELNQCIDKLETIIKTTNGSRSQGNKNFRGSRSQNSTAQRCSKNSFRGAKCGTKLSR